MNGLVVILNVKVVNGLLLLVIKLIFFLVLGLVVLYGLILSGDGK